MARLSYGGDMFSPVRCDTSLNEDSFLGGRNSDVFFGTWKDLSCDSNDTSKKEKEATKNEKSIKRKEAAVNSSFESLSNENLSKFSFLSQEVDLSKKKASHITTRNSSLRNTFKTTELHKIEENSSMKQTSNDKHKLAKHVTMRSGSRKKSTQLSGNTKLSDRFSNAFPTPDEESVEKSFDPSQSHKDNLLEYLNQQSFTHKSSNSKTEGKEKKILNHSEKMSSTNNYNKSKVVLSTVNCGIQTDLLMSDINATSNTENQKLNVCANQESNLFSSQKSSNSQQIQAGIIEKLVKDTVSFEFDSIRQMLYLQQLSLFKHLDRNAEAMKQNSTDCSVLLKIIEELMEENRQLRKIVTNQSY